MVALFPPRLVKKLMRPRTRSIAGARRAVLDRALGLYVFRLPLTEARAGHPPCSDDAARDDSIPYCIRCRASVTRAVSLRHNAYFLTHQPPARLARPSLAMLCRCAVLGV